MRTIVKDTLREIRRTWNRYQALVAIVALGVAFLAGLKSTGPNMARMGNEYFAQQNFMDTSILSTVGFNDEDVSAVAALGGVQAVQPVKWVDALYDGEDQVVVRAVSLPQGNDAVNRLWLREGRLPEAPNECVADLRRGGPSFAIGQRVILSSGNDDALSDSLSTTVYTVVGVVSAPEYLTYDRGASRIGNGTVYGLIWVQPDCFSTDYYTELDLTLQGAAGLDTFSPDYQKLSDGIDTALGLLADQRETIRGQEIRDEANDTLDEKQAEYDDARAEQQQKLADGQKKIDDAAKDLADGKRELKDNKAKAEKKFADAQKKLDSGAKQLASGRKEYDANKKKYDGAVQDAAPQFAVAQQQIDEAHAQIDAQQTQLNAAKAQLQQGQQAGVLTPDEIAGLTQQIAQGEAALTAAQTQVQQAEIELAAQKKALTDAGAQLAAAKKTLDTSAAELAKGKKDLVSARAKAKKEFEKAQGKIDDGERKVEDARKELEDARTESNEKLDDAAQKLADARQEIADLPEPSWMVQDREDNLGFSDYKGTIERTNGLAKVFPVFFYLVAALVCLTTMTRMVDKQRGQIGMMKALGYRSGAIAFKYIVYAASAGLLGGAFGLAVGFTVLPYAITHAYLTALYTLPGPLLPFHADYALLSVGVAVGVTVAATLFTCWRELVSTPAALLRPQSPKAGRRVFLERIGPLWRRLRFSHKVAARNLLRYKKRLIMTVVGVACCTALLLVGFGMKDSIGTQVVDRQFGQIMTFDANIALTDDLDDQQLAQTRANVLSAGFSGALPVHWGNVELHTADGGSRSTVLVVPMEELSGTINLRNPKTGAAIPLGDGIVLTQKLADLLHVGAGDTVTVSEGDRDSREVRVDAIAENYLMHYAFLSPQAYTAAFGEQAGTNQFLGHFAGQPDEAAQAALAAKLLATDNVAGVHLMTDTVRTMNDILKIMDLIIMIIIGAAALLAFVVLYTLTSINISERYRELATIKVLGFYDKEVGAYVFRESYVLTLIGAALGCLVGLPLHAFVLQSATVDVMVYVNRILPRSFAISCALTLVFTWFVNRMALRRLTKIDMVEALKSDE